MTRPGAGDVAVAHQRRIRVESRLKHALRTGAVRTHGQPIVRLQMKATVATLEIRKPAGQWQKVASAAYAKVLADPEGGPPHGLGFETVPSLSMLMQENRDQMVFSKFGA